MQSTQRLANASRTVAHAGLQRRRHQAPAPGSSARVRRGRGSSSRRGLRARDLRLSILVPDRCGERGDPTSDAKRLVATGEFIHANPSDPIHWGSGQVRVLGNQSGAHLVHVDESFEVGPGPSFHVYLVDHPKVHSGADFEASELVDLGRLKAFKGSQNYPVPQGIDLARYRSVVIWCKQFSVLISPATLQPAT